MHDNLSLITTIAAALGFGLIFGMIAVRFKLPALVGYLAELDRLLNDPEVRMDPDRVWTILAEISGKEAQVPVRA